MSTRIRRELLSMESLVAVVAIAVALPVVWFGGYLKAMESGFVLLFAVAVYPPIYYRESGRAIRSVSVGIFYGAGTAAAIYIIYPLCYRTVVRLWEPGIAAEGVAFVAVSVIVFGSAFIEKPTGIPKWIPMRKDSSAGCSVSLLKHSELPTSVRTGSYP